MTGPDEAIAGRDLRRSLAEAHDTNRRVAALIVGALAVIEKVDRCEDLPFGDELDAAERLLKLGWTLSVGAAAELSVAASLAARFGVDKGGGDA